MVGEDDPQWMRFWAAYPDRVSKKEARAAWAEVNPPPALVDRMLETLTWQKAQWARQGYGMPYPASWLRAERWTDEPPRQPKARVLEPVHHASCPHDPKCGSAWECQALKAKAS